MYRLKRQSRLMNRDERLPVLRPGEVVIRDGKPVKRLYRQYRLLANVQPASARELARMPEGDVAGERLYAFSQNRDEPMALNDLVLRRGKVYVVDAVEPWGGYTKGRLTKYDGAREPLEFDTTGVEQWALASF
jgi:hypothetical protein